MFAEAPHISPEMRTPSYSISFVLPRGCTCDRTNAFLHAQAGVLLLVCL